MSITVSIVEDDAEIRESLVQLIDDAPGFRCRSAFKTAEEALRQIPREPPDVVLMDINLPRLSGIECVRQLKSLLPRLNIVMLTVYENSDKVFAALEAGANGYLLKRTSTERLLQALREVHAGGAPMSAFIARKVVQSFHRRRTSSPELDQLTPREEELLRCVSTGSHNKEIADQLDISVETVRVHLRHIYEKLHVGSRSEAVVKFLQKESRP